MWERAWAVRGSRDVLKESKKVWSPWWRSRWTSACVKEYEWEILEWRGWRRFYAGLRTSRRQPTTSCAHQLKLGPSSYTSTQVPTQTQTSTQVHKHQLKLGPSSYTSTSSVNLNFAAQRKLDINFNQTFHIILQIWKWKICAHQRTGILNHFFWVFQFSASKDGYGEGEVRIPKRGVLVSGWQYLVSGRQYLVKVWQCLILRMAMFDHGWQCLVRGMAMNEDCWVPASAIAIAWPLSFLRWSTLKSFTNSLQCRDFDDGNENGNDMRYF